MADELTSNRFDCVDNVADFLIVEQQVNELRNFDVANREISSSSEAETIRLF